MVRQFKFDALSMNGAGCGFSKFTEREDEEDEWFEPLYSS